SAFVSRTKQKRRHARPAVGSTVATTVSTVPRSRGIIGSRRASTWPETGDVAGGRWAVGNEDKRGHGASGGGCPSEGGPRRMSRRVRSPPQAVPARRRTPRPPTHGAGCGRVAGAGAGHV